MRREFDEAALGLVSKELAGIINDAICIGVKHQESIVRAHPAGLFGKAIAIEFEMDAAVALRRQLISIAVEIQDDGIPAVEPVAKASLKREIDELCKAFKACLVTIGGATPASGGRIAATRGFKDDNAAACDTCIKVKLVVVDARATAKAVSDIHMKIVAYFLVRRELHCRDVDEGGGRCKQRGANGRKGIDQGRERRPIGGFALHPPLLCPAEEGQAEQDGVVPIRIGDHGACADLNKVRALAAVNDAALAQVDDDVVALATFGDSPLATKYDEPVVAISAIKLQSSVFRREGRNVTVYKVLPSRNETWLDGDKDIIAVQTRDSASSFIVDEYVITNGTFHYLVKAAVTPLAAA